MVKRILAVLVIVVLAAGFAVPYMSVSAESDVVDILDYAPVMPQGINMGTIYSTGTSGISLSGVSGGIWRISASESQTTVPDDYLTPMGGGYWMPPCAELSAGTYVLSFNARNKSSEGIIANAVFGLFDGAMGGSNAGWNWKGQYVWGEEISASEWTEVTKTFTLDYNATGTVEKSNARLKIGLGTGNTYAMYADKQNFDFRPNAALELDINTIYLAKEAVYDVVNTVSASKAVPGGKITGSAMVINQIGEKGNLNQSMEYFVTDTLGNVTDALVVEVGENGAYTVSVSEDARGGQYVITARSSAYNADRTHNFIQQPIVVTVESVYRPSADYVPLMKCALDGDILSVRTDFDDTYDLLQKFRGITSDSLDANNPVDFITSGLVPKDSETMTDISKVLCNGVDEATPFKFNGSNIGANHGQSNAILVTAPSHGKTYADIGSLWEDSAGAKWNLLKVPDGDKLLFLSENFTVNINKYYFKNSLSGVLKHVECAENTSDITVSSAAVSQQLYPSNQKVETTVYIITEGERCKLEGTVSRGCDYVEIVEKYYIMNPALIGKTLRENRPAGGYTEPQNLAIGKPLVSYNMIYRIMPDGTVFSIFDHEILEDVSFEWYGGQQYIARINAFGGGVHRYIPKLKPFTFGNNTYDFSIPVNMTTLTYPSNLLVQLTKDLWETDTAPDRQIDYFRDASDTVVASFAGGFLPIMDGEPAKRSANLNAAGFVYKSKKTYPYFVDSAFGTDGTKNKHIQGVAYKKYNSSAYDDISFYTIPYGNDIYLYVDCHKTGKRELDLKCILDGAKQIEELEKSQNVSYTRTGEKLSVSMTDGLYGYLVFRITKPLVQTETINTDGGVSVKVRNNTHQTQDVRIIAGFYNNEGVLVDAKFKDVTLGDYEGFTYIPDIPAEFDEVRVFVWEKSLKLKPFAPKTEKPL